MKSEPTRLAPSPQPSRPAPKLILPNGDEIEVKQGEYIGRTLLTKFFSKIDPKIDHMIISRKQFRIWEEAGRFYIEDEMSLNGLKLNGKEITGQGPFAIDDGDKIWISPLEQCRMVFRAQNAYGVKIISVDPTKEVFISDMDVRIRVVFHNYEAEEKVVKIITNAPGFEKDKYESAWLRIRPGMDLEDASVLIGRPLKKKALQLDVHLIDSLEMCLDSRSYSVKIHESWKDKLSRTGHYALKLIPIVMHA
jgi:hypothetical protein